MTEKCEQCVDFNKDWSERYPKVNNGQFRTCPYSEEISGKTEHCNCCDDCHDECLAAI